MDPTERHFIVFERDNAWQYSHRGVGAGPFKSRETAISAAIQEAEALHDPEVEVIVQDKDLQQETVWRHADKPV